VDSDPCCTSPLVYSLFILNVAAEQRVAQAAVSILGNVGDVAHELLSVGADALQFAPVAGLSQAAKVLLSVWDALQLVDVSCFPRPPPPIVFRSRPHI
jgi:hypothetical protein